MQPLQQGLPVKQGALIQVQYLTDVHTTSKQLSTQTKLALAWSMDEAPTQSTVACPPHTKQMQPAM